MNSDELKDFVHRQTELPFLEKDNRGKGYICPICGNGSGSSGDGLNRVPLSNSYKCFKCGEAGDAFFWLGKAENIGSFPDQLERAAAVYNVSFERNPVYENAGKTPVKKEDVRRNIPASDPSDDAAAEYIAKCHEALKNTDYFSKRGIGAEIAVRFRLGYDSSFSEGTGRYSWKAVIIPTSAVTYEARNTDVTPNSKERSGFKCRKHGRSCLFNGGVLWESREKPVFITEGCFDAMSIMECGGEAVALGGVSNVRLLCEALDKVTPSVPLIIAADNDDAGREAASKLASELSKRGIRFIDGVSVSGEFHDPNDRLMKDRAGLAQAVNELEAKALSAGAPADDQKDQYLRTSVHHALSELKEYIRLSAERPVLSTGFYQVDQELGGGIYTGLYVIGAVSSLGKTTFSLQIADNLAKSGCDVLFFSLEQSRFDLMAKSISRETFQVCRRQGLEMSSAKSSLNILSGSRYPQYSDIDRYVIETAFDNYSRYTEHLFIYEGIGNISVSEIRERVKDHISFTGNSRPVVFIDYLQILKAGEGDERATDKQVTDRNITYLKQLSRDFDIPVIAVSSLNRQNYSEKINMAAFKESGAIEYGSDVLIGLQLKGAGEADFDIRAAKTKDPREVEFIVLKNRNGRISDKGAELVYYPVFNCFRGVLDPYEDK